MLFGCLLEVQWVDHECISIVSYSILMKGQPYSYLKEMLFYQQELNTMVSKLYS